MIDAGELDVFRAGNVGREIAAALDIDPRVACAMQDEGRDADRGRMWRTSIWLFMRMSAITADGLAPSRSKRRPPLPEALVVDLRSARRR